ncbi:hypothetical protein D1AOALGA4SA_8104 [Olavius algarvensis Delta 1 endosymbiont]|nr:hypothetical protein D1AOALGA4SA_8104 [Olavius algarvensis Delta 1 endosymbiont]
MIPCSLRGSETIGYAVNLLQAEPEAGVNSKPGPLGPDLYFWE